MKCPNCGRQVPKAAKVCGYCGEPLAPISRREQKATTGSKSAGREIDTRVPVSWDWKDAVIFVAGWILSFGFLATTVQSVIQQSLFDSGGLLSFLNPLIGSSDIPIQIAVQVFLLGIVYLPIGIIQWLILRGKTSISALWILLTSFGLSIGLIIAETLGRFQLNFTLASTIYIAIMFVIMALFQWVELRKATKAFIPWLMINAVGAAIENTFVMYSPFDPATTGNVSIIFFGLIIGSGLYWLLRREQALS